MLFTFRHIAYVRMVRHMEMPWGIEVTLWVLDHQIEIVDDGRIRIADASLVIVPSKGNFKFRFTACGGELINIIIACFQNHPF